MSYTYCSKSFYANYFGNIIEKLLEKRDYFKNKKPIGNATVDFIFVDGEYAWKSRARRLPKHRIINLLDQYKRAISLKNNLYKNIKLTCPDVYKKYLPDQIEIDLFNLKHVAIKRFIKKHNKIIIKPVFECGGKNIDYFTSYKKLIKFILELKKISKRYTQDKNECPYVLSELITNIKLFENKKFHLRVHFLHVVIGKSHYSYVHKQAQIVTAKQKYDETSSDRGVMDSHYASTESDVFCNITKYKDQIKDIFGCAHKILCEAKVAGRTQADGFELFGADIIITTDETLKLLEINDKIGYMLKKSKSRYKTLMDNIFKLSIDRIFSKGKVDNAAFIRVG